MGNEGKHISFHLDEVFCFGTRRKEDEAKYFDELPVAWPLLNKKSGQGVQTASVHGWRVAS